ncbi:18S rRNA (guanine(1575)-N(7))-methyltransferase [Fusarium oxysporum f. sp. conglutinans]|nr:18S rRNA (guanine(1575)-N(7))-methyltransferase [Fusarium oxysporum f. sp. conglutinans]
MSRPEDTLAADVHYDDTEARKYTTSSRIQNIQASMTRRALELLDLKSPSLILDVGCGSGLSGEILSSIEPEEGGPHTWIGMDVSPSMLDIALQRDVEGDLMLADIGQGVPFRAGTFDAAISISAIQWLCSAETSDTSPFGRLTRFFNGLRIPQARRPSAAVKAGFGAGMLEDDPGTKNQKLYLVLTVGGGDVQKKGGDITGVVEGMEGVDVEDARRQIKAHAPICRRVNTAPFESLMLDGWPECLLPQNIMPFPLNPLEQFLLNILTLLLNKLVGEGEDVKEKLFKRVGGNGMISGGRGGILASRLT